MDPFPPTCDPAAYVARAATEDVLAGLVRELRADSPSVVLSGPSGLGKTMVLRVLAGRIADWTRCVHLPYLALGPEDLAAYALGLMDEFVPDRECGKALGALGEESRPLVLILDDATALPVETARDLANRADASGGALRLVLSLVDDEKAGQVLAALGGQVRCLRLSDPMQAFETRRYLSTRLSAAGVPLEVADRFTPRVVARLHEQSFGNPRVLGHLAARIVQGDPIEAASELDDSAWREAASEHESYGTTRRARPR